MRKYDYVLFDLDGTLTDPFEGITKSVVHSLKYYGISAKQEDLKCFIGPPLTESYEKYFGFSKEQAIEAVEHYREHFATVGLFENKAYDGIIPLLSTLKSNGCKLLLATSKPQIFAQRILDRFELSPYFDDICGSELNGERVNKSDVIAFLLNKLNINPNSAIMVGDRFHDIVGAHANSLPCIAVLYGYGSLDEFQAHSADFIASSAPDILNYII